VRRNKLSDFVDVKANGKIAMKLEEGDRLIDVLPATEHDDVLLASKFGKSIRFSVGDVRVFAGRGSTGVRGISLEGDNAVISMSILRHAEFATGERDAYLRLAASRRREAGTAEEVVEEGESAQAVTLSEERFNELARAEDFILTVSSAGFGKRSSAYEYRVTGRGGKGIEAIDLGREPATTLVAAFPVTASDQIMLVTDGGQLIRCPVHDIRIAGRATRGVTLFRVAGGERVVSVIRLGEDAANGGNGADDDAAAANGSARGNGSAGGNGTVEDGADG